MHTNLTHGPEALRNAPVHFSDALLTAAHGTRMAARPAGAPA